MGLWEFEDFATGEKSQQLPTEAMVADQVVKDAKFFLLGEDKQTQNPGRGNAAGSTSIKTTVDPPIFP
uniref:Uncharacterized protein n=1 Tax=Romanomermis culicivorax TaxID=13658 RepID=A0A915K7H8_ROMCU